MDKFLLAQLLYTLVQILRGGGSSAMVADRLERLADKLEENQ